MHCREKLAKNRKIKFGNFNFKNFENYKKILKIYGISIEIGLQLGKTFRTKLRKIFGAKIGEVKKNSLVPQLVE